MIRPILIHPDPRLRQICAPVPQIDDALCALIAEMFDTMYEAPGIGLAAPQLGIGARLLVMDCAHREGEDANDPLCLINPEIVSRADETSTYHEGCLSVPEIYADVTRPAAVRVRWLSPEGQIEERDFEGLRATCVQHEIDHLDGRLFIDFLGPMRRQLITQKMRKLKRERARAV